MKSFFKRSVIFTGLVLLAGILSPFISYSDFTSIFSGGARLRLMGDGTVVGNFSGKFSVNPSGSAVYDVSLVSPPGTAKMVPSLSLHYDSSGGNGILGMGFNLQGLTAITRVNANIAQNGLIHGVDFTIADRFALNGQQLVATSGTYGASGTEYRTYIDSQSRIISQGSQGNGPAGFVVQTKGGQTAWYGTTPDSQIKALGTNTVATWALAKIQDPAGNYITYHYTVDSANGMYYPSEIDYTANDGQDLVASNSVKFIYEDRPDPIINYTAGSLFKTTQRLKEIQSYQGTTLVSDDRLTYETSPNTFRSRLLNIQACDGAGNCLRPLQFTWQTNQMGWEEHSEWTPKEKITHSVTVNGQEYHQDLGVRFADVHGTGRPELLVSRGMPDQAYDQTNATSYANAWQATPSGWQPDSQFAPQVPFGSGYGPQYEYNHQDGNSYGTSFAGNAQGGNDLLQCWYHGGFSPGHYTNYFFATPTGWDTEVELDPPHLFSLGGLFTHARAQTADFLGTGQLGILQNTNNNLSDAESAATVFDGQNWNMISSYIPPRSFTVDGTSLGIDTGLRLVNLTSSGLPDLLMASDHEQLAWRNSGQQTPNAGTSWVPSSAFNPPSNFRFVIDSNYLGLHETRDGGGRNVEISGSGLQDLVMARNGDHENWINTGASFIPGPSTLNPPTDLVHGDDQNWYDDGVMFADVTGSGMPAWLQCSSTENGGNCRAWLNINQHWVEHDEYAPKSILTNDHGDMGVRFVDLLGTGFVDMVVYNDGQQDAWLNKAQTKPDVITTIQDGLGDHLNVQYQPITNNAIYTKGTSSQYPNMDVQAPIYVVSQTSSDTDVTPATLPAIVKKLRAFTIRNENTVQHITLYHYANAVFNHLGWGFLGFGQVSTTDQATGITATVNYSQDISAHTQGMPISTVTTNANGATINKQVMSFGTKVFGDPTGKVNASWFFPYVNQTIETAYDFNTGVQMNTKTTTTQLDDYANPTDLIVTAVDSRGSYVTETKSLYTNTTTPTQGGSLGQWLLGELTQSQLIATNPNGSITRTSTFTYDSTGFLKSSTIEPDSSTNQLTTTYTRDGFGNIVKTDISGANVNLRSEEIGYDPTGAFVISKTNALHQITTYQVDPRFGIVTQVVDPNGFKETNTLDGFGRTINTIHSDGTQTNISYQWSSGDSTAPQGSVYEVVQTQAGMPEKISYHDELDREIAQAMQGFAGVHNESKWIWQFTNYDQLGRVIGKTLPFYAGTPADQVYLTTMQYDALGRVTQTNNPDGSSVKQNYDGYSVSTTNAKGQTTTRTKNVMGNLVQVVDPEGHLTTYQYDAFNNLIQLKDSKGNVSTMSYDNLGHKIGLNDVDRGKSIYSYDALGELLSQTDANNQTTTFTYDSLARMVGRTDASGATSTWEYDTSPNGIGKLARENGVSNFIKPATKLGARDLHLTFEQQLQNELSPLVKTPDTASNTFKITQANSVQRLNAAKDNLIDYTEIYSYDSCGRLSSRAISIQGKNYITTTSYNGNSQPLVTSYPDNVAITNHYDSLGYLDQVTDNKTGVAYSTVNMMDANSHVTSVTHSNGLITNYIYDPKTNLLTDIQTNPSIGLQLERQLLPQFAKQQEEKQDWRLNIHAKTDKSPNDDQSGAAKINSLFNIKTTSPLQNGGPIQDLHYGYDQIGNVQNKQDNVLNVQDNYSYDGLNRVQQDQTVDNAHGQATTTLNYVYDELGNITNKSDVGAYNYDGSSAGPHAVKSITGLETDNFLYDANGNQTQAIMKLQDGSTTVRNMSYTSFDVPKTITQSNDKTSASATVNFFYNADRKRFMRQDQVITPDNKITKTTTLYLDGMEIDSTVDPTGKLTTVYKNYIGDSELIIDDQGNTQRFDILKDNIGSTSLITDQNGNVVQRFHYDPFGEQQLIGSSPTDRTGMTRYGFTGQEEVSSGGIDLIHMNGRMYDPHLGRFLSADPIIQDPSNSQSLNRYSYCMNNPLTLTDPSGFSWLGDLWDDVCGFVKDVFHAVCEVIHAVISNPIVTTVLEIAVAIVATAYLGPVAGIAISAAFNGVVTYAQTGSIGAALETAALTVLSESSWVGTGDFLGPKPELFEASMVHGLVGGGLNVIEGGSFKNGFLSAAVSEAMAGQISQIGAQGKGWAPMMERGLAAGVVGGTVASATGGNFENGMITSACAQMFNDDLHRAPPEQQMQESLQAKVGYSLLAYEQATVPNSNVGFDFAAAYGIGVTGGVEFTPDGVSAHLGFIPAGIGASVIAYTGSSLISNIPDGIYSETSVRGSLELLPMGAGVSLQVSPKYGVEVNPYLSSKTEGIVIETSINYGWHFKWPGSH